MLFHGGEVVVLLWLYLSGVERRLCCSGSMAWRGGHVALALSVWRGEEVVLLWLYGVEGGRVALALLVCVERRSCCSGSTRLAWRGGCVDLALSVWRGEEGVLLCLYLFGVERRLCCSGSIYLATPGSCLTFSWIHLLTYVHIICINFCHIDCLCCIFIMLLLCTYNIYCTSVHSAVGIQFNCCHPPQRSNFKLQTFYKSIFNLI